MIYLCTNSFIVHRLVPMIYITTFAIYNNFSEPPTGEFDSKMLVLGLVHVWLVGWASI